MPSAATAAGRIRHAAIRGPDQGGEGGGRPGAPLRAREAGPVAGVVAALIGVAFAQLLLATVSFREALR